MKKFILIGYNIEHRNEFINSIFEHRGVLYLNIVYGHRLVSTSTGLGLDINSANNVAHFTRYGFGEVSKNDSHKIKLSKGTLLKVSLMDIGQQLNFFYDLFESNQICL